MRKGEVCGACTGALMALGMKFGHYDESDAESKTKANEMTVKFLEEFRKANGSYICRELLGCDIATKEGAAYALGKIFLQSYVRKWLYPRLKSQKKLWRNKSHIFCSYNFLCVNTRHSGTAKPLSFIKREVFYILNIHM